MNKANDIWGQALETQAELACPGRLNSSLMLEAARAVC